MASFLNFLFGKKENSAEVAKGRLLFSIAHERANRCPADHFVRLQADLIQLITKYIQTDPHEVQIQRNRQENAEILNIILPEINAKESLTESPEQNTGFFSKWSSSKKPNTASIAKERLLIMIARDDTGHQLDYFPQLQKEIVSLIAEDLSIDPMSIRIQREQQSGCEILNIVLPDGIC